MLVVRFIKRWKWTITFSTIIIGTCILFVVITGKWYTVPLVLIYSAAVLWSRKR